MKVALKDKFKDRLLKSRVIFLDTAPIIYYIEDVSDYSGLMSAVVDFVKLGKTKVLSSTLTVTEVLVAPMRKGKTDIVNKFMLFLKNSNNISLIPISLEIAELAGRIRSKYLFLRTADAIQISAAIVSKANYFLTNDKDLKRVKEIKVIFLGDYI